MQQRFSNSFSPARIGAGILSLSALYFVSLFSYPIFHTFAEFFSIVIGFCLFLIIWNSRRIAENNYLLFIGIAYVFVAFIDLVHALAYKGINIFSGYGTNLPTQLWIAARYLQSLSLLAAPLFISRKLRAYWTLAGFATLTALVLASIFLRLFPDCYIEGEGLTRFKIVSEYLISAILICSCILMLKKRAGFSREVITPIILSIIATIASELAFTFYIGAYDFSNLIGHFLKIIAFYLIYRAIMETGFFQPFSLLFRNLKQQEEVLRESEKQYRLLFAANPSSMFVFDAETFRFLAVNDAAVAHYGWSREEFLAMTVWEVRPAEDRQLAQDTITRHRGAHDPGIGVFRHCRKDGTVMDMEITASSISFEGRPARLWLMNDITERKRAEEAAHLSEEKFALAFANNPAAIAVSRLEDGLIIEVNETWLALTGYSREEALGHSAREMHIWPTTEASSHFVRELQEKGSLRGWEQEFLKKNGEVYAAQLSAQVLTLRDEKVILSTLVDITERKRAEEELLQNRMDMDRAQEVSQIGSWRLDTCRNVLTWSDENYRIFGVPKGTPLTYEAFLAIVHPDDRQYVDTRWTDGLRGGPYDIEHRIVVDGQVKWVREKAYPEFASTGGLLGGFGITQDITERKKMEEELERHHRYLEEMVRERTVALRRNQDLLNETQRVSKVGGWEFDVITRRVTWTDEVYRIHEVSTAYDPSSPEQDIQFYAPEDRERIADSFQRAVAQGEPYDLELQLVTARGNRLWVRTMGQAESEGGKVVRVFGNIMDITERKQLEEQLRQSQKMEAIGTLAGGIAHDFNNILAAILGFTEMVIDDVPDPDVQRNLNNVLKASMRAKDLVKQILAFSRKTNYERAPLSLSPLVKETVQLLRASIPSTIEIRLDIASSWDRILAAPVEVHQVVMNLATNASLAMQEKGGILEVRLTDIDFTPDSPVFGPDVMPGEYVQLTVKDTGIGMTPDVMKRVFEPFFTTREVGKGTGMGLAVVYGIVKDLQGTITVESIPGVGSTFRVLLPKVQAEALKEDADKGRISGGNERILFIDDEEMLVEWGRATLERLGYKVTAVTDSKEALNIFSSDPSRFDLVITDYTMPGITGIQLARELLKLRPDTPVILCTGHSETVSPEIAKEAGIREYLMKPLAKQELAEAVRRVLDTASGG